jgi:hypothetical protein
MQVIVKINTFTKIKKSIVICILQYIGGKNDDF